VDERKGRRVLGRSDRFGEELKERAFGGEEERGKRGKPATTSTTKEQETRMERRGQTLPDE
jgi:hypothetical protein